MKILEKIKTNYWAIVLLLIIIIFFRQCGIRRDIDKIEKNVKIITVKIDSVQNTMVTRDQVKYEMDQTMFNFLIYEDDFDKGRSSLSDIKNKINRSEKN